MMTARCSSRRFTTVRRLPFTHPDRRGSIAVFTAFVLVIMAGFLALSVDMGMIVLAQAQLAKAADAAALGGCLELVDSNGTGATISAAVADVSARNAAAAVASYNRGLDTDTVYVKQSEDVRTGRYEWDALQGAWVKTWDSAPLNMVEVTTRRSLSRTDDGGAFDLAFARVMGIDETSFEANATAACLPGAGFRINGEGGYNAMVLPIALDEPTWNNAINGMGDDNFSYDAVTDTVTSGSDGVAEVSLYPDTDKSLPSGNRGTVDIGSSNNSTNDLKRQILFGINEDDLTYTGGTLRYDQPLTLNGDTGLSAAIKAELTDIIGKSRAIPIFSSVSGQGDNTTYVIEKFVGVRVLDVKLTGKTKRVVIQPAPFASPAVIPGKTAIEPDTIFTLPMLID